MVGSGVSGVRWWTLLQARPKTGFSASSLERSRVWRSERVWQRVADGVSRPIRRRKREKVHLLWRVIRVVKGGARSLWWISSSWDSER